MKKYVLAHFDLSKIGIVIPIFTQKSRPKTEYNTTKVYIDIIVSEKNKWKEKIEQLSKKNPFNHMFKPKEQKKYISFYNVFSDYNASGDKIYNQVIEYHGHIFKINAYDTKCLYIYFKRSIFKNYFEYILTKAIILNGILISAGVNIKKIKIIIVRTGQIISIDTASVKIDQILSTLDQLIDQYENMKQEHIFFEKIGWCHQPFTLFKQIYSYPTQIYFNNQDQLINFEKMIRTPFSGTIFIHSPNNINTCSSEKWFIGLVRRELHICEEYGIKGAVIHVGKSLNVPIEYALKQMQKNLIDFVRYTSFDQRGVLLLETPAGQKTEVLTTPELLGKFFNKIPSSYREKIKICLDTCHVFATGYLPHVYLKKIVSIIGENNIGLVHFNDSVYPKNSHIDRHAPIGEGYIPISSLNKVRTWCEQRNISMIREY
uniref:AP (Apurinic) endonuclease family 2 n=1 Tax=Pithovirus LCPAC001 TaxID=2506585 RepID=A0A481Z1A1_9VIRU|nr:MAG: AP (apurinic) endonuclease family 2 [Pithovirus LCPAC001]